MHKLGQYPIEIFGHLYDDKSKTAVNDRNLQFCPFLQRECAKPRKSEPHIKVGICTVGYKSSFMDRLEPIIICPHRFLEKVVFQSIRDRFSTHQNQRARQHVCPEWRYS